MICLSVVIKILEGLLLSKEGGYEAWFSVLWLKVRIQVVGAVCGFIGKGEGCWEIDIIANAVRGVVWS